MKTISLEDRTALSAILVTGAETAEANGRYVPANVILGRVAYLKEDLSGWQIAYTVAPENTFLLSNPANAPLYAAEETGYIPPRFNWETILGANPAPIIGYEYPEEPYKDLHLDLAGNLAVANDSEGLRQKIETRLKLDRGEWFLNSGAGVPYIQSILGRAQPDKDLVGSVTQILDIEVLKEPEVLSILNSQAEFDRKSRRFTYTAELETTYGTVSLQEIGNG